MTNEQEFWFSGLGFLILSYLQEGWTATASAILAALFMIVSLFERAAKK